MRDVEREQLPAVVGSQADLVTLLAGGNDVLRADFDARKVGESALRICEASVDAGALFVVVLLHQPQRVLPRGGYAFGRVVGRRASEVNDDLVSRLAGHPRVVVVDPAMMPEAHIRSHWSFDRMHPSPLGHRLLARAVGRAVAVPLGVVVEEDSSNEAVRGHHPVAVAGWLMFRGVPWLLKRSVDLVPEIVRVVLSEERHQASIAVAQGNSSPQLSESLNARNL